MSLRPALWFFLFLCTVASCDHLGPAFDKTCVEGRLSNEQAQAINELEWEKCPSYREECKAEVNDRVIKKQCSELSRKIFYWD